MKFSIQQRNNVIISTAILAGIIIIVNIISYGVFKRFDLTSERLFSISPATKDILKKLDDMVTIKAYFSEELPVELLVLRQEVKDILDEYTNYSGGKLKVQFIDPHDDQEKLKEAQSLGIPQVQFNIRARDKFEVRNGFFGLAIIYLDKKEVIPLIQDTRTLEYDLTAAIKKVATTEETKIGFLFGHGEWEIDDDVTVIKKDLQKQYQVSSINILEGKSIPKDIKTLVIVGPKEEYTTKDLYIIDQFVMNGGNLFVSLDSSGVDNTLQSRDLETGLENLLKSYGLGINKNMVLDVFNEMVSFSSGFVQYFTPYPFWPEIIKTGFNQENAITSKLESLVLPWVATIDILSGKTGGKQVVELAKTSDKSWVVNTPFNLNPQQEFIAPEVTQPYNIAVAVSGKFESYYKENTSALTGLGEEFTSDFKDSGERASIVLVSDGDFMQDDFVSRFPDNRVFFENIVDYLSLGEELISIRSRGVSESSLKDLSDGSKRALKFANIFGVTALVVLYGVFRFYSRRKKRFADEL